MSIFDDDQPESFTGNLMPLLGIFGAVIVAAIFVAWVMSAR
jgi:hypothetical protein